MKSDDVPAACSRAVHVALPDLDWIDVLSMANDAFPSPGACLALVSSRPAVQAAPRAEGLPG